MSTAACNETTVVTACNESYAWGAWLLVSSMRRAGMTERVLIGVHGLDETWRNDFARLPGVELMELPPDTPHCPACRKPDVMLQVRTEYASWVDCDGIFEGDCGELLLPAEPGKIHCKPHRAPGVNPKKYLIPPNVLAVWRRDVGERAEPRLASGFATGIITVPRKAFPFLEKWRAQMRRVLPPDTGVVSTREGYFQTDEAVWNSLLFFAYDAPEIAAGYRLAGTERRYLHFGYTPKPWQSWNAYSIRYHRHVMALLDWCAANGMLPRAPLPPSLRKSRTVLHYLQAPLAKWFVRVRKLRQKLFSK